MTRIPNPQVLELTYKLVSLEATASQPAETQTLPAFRVIAKLGRSLSTLAGTAGFRSLLARAVAMTRAEGLGAVQLNADGSLDSCAGFDNPEEAAEAGIKVLAQLLGLLNTFIGESLTLRLVLDVWPDLPAMDDQIPEKKQS